MNPAVREHLDYILGIIHNADLQGDDLREFREELIRELESAQSAKSADSTEASQ